MRVGTRYRGPTILGRRAHRVSSNPLRVQDGCSCLSARERLKPAVFLLSPVFSCSTLICAAAEVSPCTVFMSHITYLIFALCWSVKLTAFSCQFGRRNGKRKNLSPTHPFTQMEIRLWVCGQETLGHGPEVHLKWFRKMTLCFIH